jgi:hypothetical protein
MSTTLGSESLGELGSLAQSARTKHLKTARGILFFCGITTVLLNIVFVVGAKSIVESEFEKELKPLRAQGMEIDEAKLAELREQAVRTVQLANGIAVLIGVVFIVCGVLVYQYPVPATVISLVLFLGSAAVYGYLDPTTLQRGWWLKIIFAICLFKAVQAAVAFESERKTASIKEGVPDFPAMPS